MVDDPNFSAALLINSGFFIAAVLNATLSAPASKALVKSSILLNPPETVTGIKTFFVVFSTISNRLFLPYNDATTS